MARMHNPAYPGEVLREFLPPDMSIGEVAFRLVTGAIPGHTSIKLEVLL